MSNHVSETPQGGRSGTVRRASLEYPTYISIVRTISRYVRAGGEVVAESLWPTRCVICDKPGELICIECRRQLPRIDYWRACPSCGAPFGRLECTECIPLSLQGTGRTALPFAGCVSAFSYDDSVARIVRAHKDAGERRLARSMAYPIACAIPPEWVRDDCSITYIPATAAAKSRRGFDHGRSLACEAAELLGMRCEALLQRPRSRDQRRLSRDERFANMGGRFRAVEGPLPEQVLLLDDVYTTGATLCAATDALVEAGVRQVRCATFARVY